MDSGELARLRIDTSVAHPARRYDYWLGGKDNFAVDREAGDRIAELFPSTRLAVIENRLLLRRMVTALIRDHGVRQFLDIGTGLPSADNTHEVAQSIAPETRVAYVDNDPMVLAHARALLTSAPQGATGYLDADLREPATILASPELTRVLDLSRPVALMLIAVLHFIEGDAQALIAEFMDALPSGSYLAISTGTHIASETQEQIFSVPSSVGWYPRTSEEITRLFTGLELLPPGLVPAATWRAENEKQPRPPLGDVPMFAGLAVKP